MLVALREAGALGVSRRLLARGRASATPAAAGLRAALWQVSTRAEPAAATTAAAAGGCGIAHATTHPTSRRPTVCTCSSRASCAPAAAVGCVPSAARAARTQQRLAAGGVGISGRGTLAAGVCISSRSIGSTSRAAGITPCALSNATMQQQQSAGAQDAVAAGGSAGAGLAKAVVRAPAGADALVVTVSLGAKTCNLNRPCDELLEKALTRLAKNLTAKPSKKEKRKKPAGGPSAGPSSAEASQDDSGGAGAAVLYEDAEGTQPLPLTLTNGEAWRRGVLLEVAGERFAVEVNPPTVDKITIDRLAMVGYPTAAAVQLSFAEVGGCRWRWAAQRPGESQWRDLGCATQHYTPRPEDEGCVLRVECTPTAARPPRRAQDPAAGGAGGEGEAEAWLGDTVSAVTGPVGRGPERCSASVRCAGTVATHVAAPAFRILSYNILADQYAGSEYAQNVLFKYCPKENLDPAYRRALVLRELLGYHADVICLQEVDERAFTDFLSLHLRLHGYEGHYTNKQGKVKEGSATFWRTARFRALAHQDIRLREAFALPLPPLHSQFGPMLEASKELATALQQVTTIAQATLLAPVSPSASEGCLCVVNTHLFFHPYAPHIRTMHTAGILEEAAAFLARCADGTQPPAAGANVDELRTAASFGPGPEAPGVSVSASMSGGLQRPTVVFCGDLNSDLNDGIPGVVELLRKGALPHDYWDWVQGAAFKWGMGEEDAEAMAQGTAQIQEAAAAATAAAAAAAAGSPPPSAVGATRSASMSSVDPAAAAAATGSLFAADGHAFESASTTPAVPIAVTGLDIRLPYVFRAADDLATPYTNYTSGYKALLDYVWYEEAVLKVLGTAAPVPSEQELGGFIPSPAFPSDHLAVVYDMTWRRPGDGSE